MGDAGTRVGTFGALVRRYRLAASLSQEALAERAGLSVDAISVIERGKRGAPRPDTVALLARALGLSDEERAAFAVATRAIGVPPEAPPAPVRTPPHALPPLPVPLTALVGRAREVAAVRARLLEPGTRLLTLTGPGGVGKTRLAVEVARAAHAAFPDGVAFVSLAALTDPALVLPTIAHTIGLGDAAGRTPAEMLVTALAGLRALLVLDNLEQVAAAAPAIAEVLTVTPGVTVLATSRERLHLRGERVIPVPPLAIPDPTRTLPVDDLLHYGAVRLLVERARDAAPDFALTERNAAQVAAICARLDGLPLALELAAAHVRVLPPAALLCQLDRGLALLMGGPRDLPARQQTLRATIDWSYDLLDEEGQALFRRLSVFVGGCALETAEAVCRALEGLARLEGDMLARLVELADQSLLTVAGEADGEVRFGMMETIRAYGRNQAEAAGEAGVLRQAHAAYYLALAKRAELALKGSDQGMWLARLEREHDNLRAALDWALEHGASGVAPAWEPHTEPSRRAIGLRLASALEHFWGRRGHAIEGRRRLEALLAGGDGVAAPIRAQAYAAAGTLAWILSDYAQAGAFHTGALALYRALGDTRGMATALHNLGTVAYYQGDFERSGPYEEDALALYRALEDNGEVGRTLNGLGLLARERRDYDRAITLYEEALAFCRTQGDTFHMGIILSNLGEVACDQGAYEHAAVLYEESLALLQALDEKTARRDALQGLAGAVRHLGQHGRALALYAESLAQQRVGGNRRQVVYCLEGMAEAQCAQGEPERAARLYGAADALEHVHKPTALPPYLLVDHEVRCCQKRRDPAATSGRPTRRTRPRAVSKRPGRHDGGVRVLPIPREPPIVPLLVWKQYLLSMEGLWTRSYARPSAHPCPRPTTRGTTQQWRSREPRWETSDSRRHGPRATR